MFEPATTRASPDLAAKAERRRQKFALKEWEGSATRAAHDARVRSAKSQYADLFHANGNTQGARRGASPAGAPATPAAGSYADTEMARRARRTPPSNARLARTPKTPESARVASRADASGGRNLDAALSASPPREAPGSRIRAAAAVALSPDSKYRAEVFGERAGETEASPGARRGVDRGGGESEGGSPLGPESSLGGSRLARRGSSRSPASRLPSPPVTRGALGDVSDVPEGGLVASELATPPLAAREESAPRPGSSARPSTGRNLARFLKRRQALRRAEADRAAEKDDDDACLETRDANKENVDPAWAEYEACPAADAKAESRTKSFDAPTNPSAPRRAPLAPLAYDATDDGKENLDGFFSRRSPEAETRSGSEASSPQTRAGEGRDASLFYDAFAPGFAPEPFFVRDDDEDAYPPTPSLTPSPLRSANANTHAAWLERGYGAIRASAAAAAPRYAEDEPESDAGETLDDAWNEYALPDSKHEATHGGFDEARVEPFKMVSPGALRRAAAETARSASLARYA
jgi:hypothetical protein